MLVVHNVISCMMKVLCVAAIAAGCLLGAVRLIGQVSAMKPIDCTPAHAPPQELAWCRDMLNRMAMQQP